MLKDLNGFVFMVGFVDGVMCLEDLWVVGCKFVELSDIILLLFFGYLCVVIKMGGFWVLKFFGVVVLIFCCVLCVMVGYFVFDVMLFKFGFVIVKLCKSGNCFNFNLFGEVVFGECEVGYCL